MHVVVTGGAGFVGSVLVPRLLSAGHSVALLDWFLFRPTTSFGEHPRLRLVRGDIRDERAVTDVARGADAVIHLAAMANDPSSELDPAATVAINFHGTCNLVRLAKKLGIRRFINASSASVYGVRDDDDVHEGLELRPQTVYASSKAQAEEYVLACADSQFVTTSLRPATLSGLSPRMRLDLTANIFCYQALTERRLRIFGGGQFRPNLSVLDMVRAYELLLSIPPNLVGGKTFNLCERNYSVREIAETANQVVANGTLPLDVVETVDNRSYRLSASLAKNQLGFTPEHSLTKSIADVAEALTQGRIRNPGDAVYRNVELLKQRGIPSEPFGTPHA